jgi:predicted nucleic acid-binding protein
VTLVDTNVLLDVIASDPAWSGWSIDAMGRQSVVGPLLINEVIFAELSARMDTLGEVERAVYCLEVRVDRIPREALFLAGQAFRRYRATGGVRTGVLPDFFIGAHAQVTGLPFLTRDVRRYRTYFPDVRLIAP